jgi:hypothetical protein
MARDKLRRTATNRDELRRPEMRRLSACDDRVALLTILRSLLHPQPGPPRMAITSCCAEAVSQVGHFSCLFTFAPRLVSCPGFVRQCEVSLVAASSFSPREASRGSKRSDAELNPIFWSVVGLLLRRYGISIPSLSVKTIVVTAML